jgi:glycerol-3-phosphate acyltransferase PlsY
MFVVVGKLLVAYLIGSVSGSLLLGRWRGVDIRTLGSGNAGGTNALRTQGLRFALGVMLIDVGKGALATWIGLQGEAEATMALRVALCCGFAAVLGHVWPIFHGFRGGKGVATVIGLLLVLWPMLLLPMIGVFAWFYACGYVGLGLSSPGSRCCRRMVDGARRCLQVDRSAGTSRDVQRCVPHREPARVLARLFRR